VSAGSSALRRLSIAVVSWNGLHHLKTCLEALAGQEDPGLPWELLLLDNGSRDGTAAWVRARHPAVRLIESPVNLGFCAGNNRLVEAATGDAVAFLNNDTRPEPGWLRGLAEALRAAPPDVAAVSGQIVDWDAERLDFARGIMTFDGHAFQLDFRRPLAAARIPAAGAELPFACGGNMLVRRASFLGAGGFDADYFAYLEDVDLGWRLWAGGERVTFAPAAVARHRSSATSDLLGLFNRGFLFERNAFLTACKNYEEGLWQKVMPAVLMTLLARTQTLLAENNPGGDSLRVDPYAGWIADTAAAGDVPAGESAPRLTPGRLADRLAELGPREALRRAWRKLAAAARGREEEAAAPTLADERTVAQLRAVSYLVGHLDAAAAKRRAVQARRRRSDREVFERFPAYLVPTYPGDEHLFARPGFRAWFPPELPLVEARLDEVMELER
jgi:GT2 family glycosyltransferase